MGGAFSGNNQFPATPPRITASWSPSAWKGSSKRWRSGSPALPTRGPEGGVGGYEAVPGGHVRTGRPLCRRGPAHGRRGVRPGPPPGAAGHRGHLRQSAPQGSGDLPGGHSVPLVRLYVRDAGELGAPATPSCASTSIWPLYEADRAKGLSLEEAYQYLAMLLVNCNSACVVYSEARSHGFLKRTAPAAPSPSAASSPTAAARSMSCPTWCWRRSGRSTWAATTWWSALQTTPPEDFILLACEVARDVGGQAEVPGDKTAVANLERDGMTRQQANDYAVVGCTSPHRGRAELQYPRGHHLSARHSGAGLEQRRPPDDRSPAGPENRRSRRICQL